MNLKKINYYINKFLSLKPSDLFKKKKTSKKRKFILNKTEQTSFIKKRRNLSINNKHLEKLKIFWNNTSHYYILLLAILLLTLIYIIFWPLFKIKNIEIIKQDNITNMQIAYKAVDNYRWKSILSIEKKHILENLQKYQHNISSIKTDIILPNTLKIIIDSYKWAYNTTINWKTFLITNNWTLIPSSYSKDLKELIIKKKFDKNKFLDYKKSLDKEYINKITKIISSIKENIIDLEIKELTYYVIERELHIETEKNTTIIFDLNWEYKEQIEKIVIFNKDYMNVNKSAIIYIDLRIKNKVFYCTNENEYQCLTNIKSIYSIE